MHSFRAGVGGLHLGFRMGARRERKRMARGCDWLILSLSPMVGAAKKKF